MGDMAMEATLRAMVDDRIENDDYDPGYINVVPNTGPAEPPCLCGLPSDNEWLEWEFWATGDDPVCPLHERDDEEDE